MSLAGLHERGLRSDLPSDVDDDLAPLETMIRAGTPPTRPLSLGKSKRTSHQRNRSSISVKVERKDSSSAFVRSPSQHPLQQVADGTEDDASAAASAVAAIEAAIDPPDNLLSDPIQVSQSQTADHQQLFWQSHTDDDLLSSPTVSSQPDPDPGSLPVENAANTSSTVGDDQILQPTFVASVNTAEEGGEEEQDRTPQKHHPVPISIKQETQTESNAEQKNEDGGSELAPALPEKDALSLPAGVSTFSSPKRNYSLQSSTGSPRSIPSSDQSHWSGMGGVARRDATRASLLNGGFDRRPSGASVATSSPRQASWDDQTPAHLQSRTIPLRRGGGAAAGSKRMSLGYISSSAATGSLNGLGKLGPAARIASGTGPPPALSSAVHTPVTEREGYMGDTSDASYFHVGRSPSISSVGSTTSRSAAGMPRMTPSTTGNSTPAYENGPISAVSQRSSLLDSPLRSGRDEAETIMTRSKDLLSVIASKEQRCLELREELKREETELKALQKQWQASVSQTLAQEGSVDQPLQKAATARRKNAGTGSGSKAEGGSSISSLSSVSEDRADGDGTSETSELSAMQQAAAETIKGWSGKISNFFEVALAAPTPDGRFSNHNAGASNDPGNTPPEVPSKQLESLSETEEEDADLPTSKLANAKIERDVPERSQTITPRPPSSSTARSSTASKRTSIFGAFAGFQAPSSPSNSSTGASASAWSNNLSQRFKEAREGASTLLAKAEKGLESIVTIDEASMKERPAKIQGGVVIDDSILQDGAMPRRINLETANERERSALRGLGSDWFGRNKSPSPGPPSNDSSRRTSSAGFAAIEGDARLSPGSRDDISKRLSAASTNTVTSASAPSLSDATSVTAAEADFGAAAKKKEEDDWGW